jgi:hypothetical protein
MCTRSFDNNNNISGRQRQDVKVLQRFVDWIRPHIQGDIDGLVPCCPARALDEFARNLSGPQAGQKYTEYPGGEGTESSVASWICGRNQFFRRNRYFALSYGCLPENMLLHSVAAKASGLIQSLLLVQTSAVN